MPLLPSLVDTTAQSFDMREASFDKAYLSDFNLAFVMDKGAIPFIPFKSNTTGQGSPMWESLYHF